MSAANNDYGEDLLQLIAQYGQDFSDEYGSEREAFDDFASHAAGDPRAGALIALDQLLADADSEEDLAAALNKLAFAYVVTAAGHASYRAFLLQLRAWLVESLQQRPGVGTDG